MRLRNTLGRFVGSAVLVLFFLFAVWCGFHPMSVLADDGGLTAPWDDGNANGDPPDSTAANPEQPPSAGDSGTWVVVFALLSAVL